jgi:hypothetical protein
MTIYKGTSESEIPLVVSCRPRDTRDKLCMTLSWKDFLLKKNYAGISGPMYALPSVRRLTETTETVSREYVMSQYALPSVMRTTRDSRL